MALPTIIEHGAGRRALTRAVRPMRRRAAAASASSHDKMALRDLLRRAAELRLKVVSGPRRRRAPILDILLLLVSRSRSLRSEIWRSSPRVNLHGAILARIDVGLTAKCIFVAIQGVR